jgi:hypothetical protein
MGHLRGCFFMHHPASAACRLFLQAQHGNQPERSDRLDLLCNFSTIIDCNVT